jgi:polyphosphate kinase 2 (PPK2 family)
MSKAKKVESATAKKKSRSTLSPANYLEALVEETSRSLQGSNETPPKLRRKHYEEELQRLQVELVQLQQWVVRSGAKVCIVFEGRDTAGKGGVIKRITERVSPRIFRVVALPAPSDREKSQMYIQRYLPHLPAGGEIVIFDRSWYNRAGVERVMDSAPRKRPSGSSL